jgi:hypothetical protein
VRAGPRGAAGRRARARPRGATGSRGWGRLARRPGFRAAGTLHAAGTPHPVSSAREVAAAAEPAGQPVRSAASRGRPPGRGSLRPGIRAAAPPPPCGRPAAGPRVARCDVRRPSSAPRTPREHLAARETAQAPGSRRTREAWPLPRSPVRAHRGECRSGRRANTRSSGPAPASVRGPAPRTPAHGAGDWRACGGPHLWTSRLGRTRKPARQPGQPRDPL